MTSKWALRNDNQNAESGEVGAGDGGDGGDGGGFGAEDAWAEGDVGPCVSGEEGDFFGSPAAFGADGKRQLQIIGFRFQVGRGG